MVGLFTQTAVYWGSFKEIYSYLRAGDFDISRTHNKILVGIATIIAKICKMLFMCQTLFLALQIY